MQDKHTRPAGLGDALSHLTSSALAIVRSRLELATIEFAEERERAKEMLLLVLSTVLLSLFALLFASVFIIAYFWDSNRLLAVGGVTAVYVILAGVLLLRLRQRAREKHSPFAATLSQLDEDAAALRARP